MKVAILCINYHKKGGSERRTYELVERLTKAGDEVHVFANKFADINKQVIIHKVPMIKLLSFLKGLSFATISKQSLKKFKFDIIHSQARTLSQDLVTVGGGCHRDYLSRTLGDKAPFLRFLKLLNPLHLVTCAIESYQYRKEHCSKIIANSNLSKKGILRYHQYPEEDIIVIHNGVDTKDFCPENCPLYNENIREKFNLSLNDLIILLVGAGFARKGVEYLIKAVAQLGEETIKTYQIKVLIVGKGNHSPYLNLAKELNIKDRVVFAGSTSRVKEFYAASDIFILPTLFDPFANTTLEAMATGLPVITSYTNGVSEIIEDGINGFVTGATDTKGIAEKIKILLEQDFREKMGEEARKTAQKYTWDLTAKKTREVYEEIVKS